MPSSSGTAPAPSTAAPAAAPSPTAPIAGQALTRARGKRKYKEGEREEYEAHRKFGQTLHDVIASGPFFEGLMSFGGRIPKDVYNALRAKFVKEFKARNEESLADLPGRELNVLVRKKFSESCGWKERRKMLQEIISTEESKPERESFVAQCKAVKECLEAKHLGIKQVDPTRQQINALIVLVVYNDERFLVEDLKQDPAHLLSHDMLVDRLREFTPYKKLKESFFSFCKELGRKWKVEWAASLEVLSGTYKEKGEVRLQLNLAVGRKASALRFDYPYKELAFCKCLPEYHPARDRIAEVQAVKRNGFNKMWGQTAYNIQIPKFWSVDSDGSKLPFKDYPVSQTQITGYLQVIN